ncbi:MULTISPECIES: hypothetical protein [unclassified Caballeronia]|uniref:hypothetical protein n=1 Tax=unclassified Caballeronia TaxID=2646786 RepID=UPI002858B8DD|nr:MULTISPECIES: hypothetical protein [unclassified Caballeronia]MDR5750104.1 hypothetical protein [Caballeronia sp. LZ024]MDR5842768.1 hypothetical protein [Caballeronia sp. LZ031]
MNPKLSLTALASAVALSGCYYVGPYGYSAYPPYPAYPVVGAAYTQREVPVGTQSTTEPSGDPATAATTTQYVVAQPPVAYSTYPAYYPTYPYPVYPAYYGYGYPAISVGFGYWGGGGCCWGGHGGWHGGGGGWHGGGGGWHGGGSGWHGGGGMGHSH